MNRKQITALIVGCEQNQFMVYRDEEDLGTVAVGPDGKKYRISNEELAAAEKEAERERAEQPEAVPASGTKGKPQPEPAKPEPEAKAEPAPKRRRTAAKKK